jgi:hypothetical protein
VRRELVIQRLALRQREDAAALQHARDALQAARGAFVDGDPFAKATMHSHVHRALKAMAEAHERNAAFAVRLALAGAEDAHEALTDLIAERNERGEALGSALTTYVNMLADHGRPRLRRPAVKPMANYLANFVIICMALDLKQQCPWLHLRRRLNEARLASGTEAAISKIWYEYGPPVAPSVWHWQKSDRSAS